MPSQFWVAAKKLGTVLTPDANTRKWTPKNSAFGSEYFYNGSSPIARLSMRSIYSAPVVSFQTNADRIYVKYADPHINWTDLDGLSFDGTNPSISEYNDLLYLAYQNLEHKIVLMMHDGLQWNWLDRDGFDADTTMSLPALFVHDNIPYIAYRYDGSSGYVKYFVGE